MSDHKQLATQERTVRCTDAFSHFGRRRHSAQELVVAVNEHTYLPDGELTCGWFPNVSRAFLKLAQQNRQGHHFIQSFASIGAGAGLEVIAAVEAFNLSHIVVADLHWDAVELAKRNVLANCGDIVASHVEALVSNVCAELVFRKIKVDLMYENLPNLPANDIDISHGVTSASFFERRNTRDVPGTYARHRLSLHYVFLAHARECLLRGGRVVSCIGGRVPIAVVRQMFSECGYTAEPLHFEVVRQFESESVLPGYAEAEASGDPTFRFFPFEQAASALREMRKAGEVTVDDIFADERMKRLTVSATEALQLQQAGTDIGHIGVVWLGKPR